MGQIKIGEATKLAQTSSQDAALMAELRQKCEGQSQELQKLGSQLVEMGKLKSQTEDQNLKLKQEIDGVNQQLAKSKQDIER